jgi:quercetin dioxygenase-like cupin family protein
MIKVRRLSEEPGEKELETGSRSATAVEIVLKRSDIEAFSSRLLRIEPGGHTAYHTHTREHVVLVVSGRCRVEMNDQTENVGEGYVVSVPADAPHRFFNPGPERLAILVLNFFPPESKMHQETTKQRPEAQSLGPTLEYEPTPLSLEKE